MDPAVRTALEANPRVDLEKWGAGARLVEFTEAWPPPRDIEGR